MPLTLGALEREITELDSHTTLRLAAGSGWTPSATAVRDGRIGGASSSAHWMSWRCEAVMVAAREHANLARKLEELPLARKTFAERRRSYP